MKKGPIIYSLIAWSMVSIQASELPDSESLSRLIEGEILLQNTRTDEKGGAARVDIVVHAPVETIWGVLISCKNNFIFIDGLQTCEVLEETGLHALTHQVVNKGWPIPTQDFVFETERKPYTHMAFWLKEGNLKAMEGSWEFTPMLEGVLVTYEIRVVPGTPAPRWMVRRSMQKGMPDMLACIRALAGGSGSEELRIKDMDRCPGDASTF
jgi:hypothetical protein